MIVIMGITAVGFLVAAIIVLIKKPKNRIFISIVCLFAVVFFIGYSIPYYIDANKQDTASFVGVYTKYQAGFAGTTPHTFIVSGERQSVYSAAFDSTYNNFFEEGKKYKVEYFVHTRIISRVEIIE